MKQVEQVSFSGEVARAASHDVLFVTERAVFRLLADGVELTELAPGIDLERDLLQRMEFKPLIRNVRPMRATLFAAR